MRDLASRLGGTRVSRATWQRETGISEHFVLKVFDTYGELCSAAGLGLGLAGEGRETTTILEEMDRVFSERGVLSRTVFDQASNLSTALVEKRFGGWTKAKIALAAWLSRPIRMPHISPNFKARLLGRPAAAIRRRGGRASIPRRRCSTASLCRSGRFVTHVRKKLVVFVFGLLAEDLGFAVEWIGQKFPELPRKTPHEQGNLGGSVHRVRVSCRRNSSSTDTIRRSATSSSAGTTTGKPGRPEGLEVIALDEIVKGAVRPTS